MYIFTHVGLMITTHTLFHAATHCNKSKTFQHTVPVIVGRNKFDRQCNGACNPLRWASVVRCVTACCSVLQCVAACCSVLQCVAVCCCVLLVAIHSDEQVSNTLFKALCSFLLETCEALLSPNQCVAVCCRVLPCVAVCVLPCVAVCYVHTCTYVNPVFKVLCVFLLEACEALLSLNQCVAVCCSVLQYVAVCCSVLQCVAVHCTHLNNIYIYICQSSVQSVVCIPAWDTRGAALVESVCCSVLQCVAVCGSVLPCVVFKQYIHIQMSIQCSKRYANFCLRHVRRCSRQISSTIWQMPMLRSTNWRLLVLSMLQCVAVCCSVLKCGAVRCSVMRCDAVLQCVAVWCSVLECVVVCCSVMQWVAVCCNVM